jgi:TRAP-type transport system periplasmic protein
LGHVNTVEDPISIRLVEWARAVKTQTNGRLNITIFPDSALGGQGSLLTQLRQGAIQFFVTVTAAYTGVVPVAAIDSVGFAFRTPREPSATLEGPLGEYVRKEFASRGIYAFEKMWEHGMRQVLSSTRPIRTASDFANLKIRTPAAKISVDLFTTLGASPTPLDSSEIYTGLQTHLVDATEAPATNILTQRFYEVQKYLSITNHQWSGNWFTANGEAWNALPPDIRAIADRNATKYALLERNDGFLFDAAAVDKLRRQGLLVNAADAGSMRARLGPYYARWKNELGSKAWDLLEAHVGRLA